MHGPGLQRDSQLCAPIIVLTILIRLLLLPFGFKQIKSMQHMQALQPEIKELQKKFKNNKQKLQEEHDEAVQARPA